MKIPGKKILIISLVQSVFISSPAQNQYQKIRLYDTWVIMNSRPGLIKGVLYETKDSSISIANSKSQVDYLRENYYKEFHKNTINNFIIAESDNYALREAAIGISILNDAGLKANFNRDFLTGNLYSVKIRYNYIETIKTRRKNNVLKGALIGGAFGCVAGATIANNKGGEIDPAFNILLGMAVYSGLGALIGSIKHQFPVHGDYEKYRSNIPKLKKYSCNKTVP